MEVGGMAAACADSPPPTHPDTTTTTTTTSPSSFSSTTTTTTSYSTTTTSTTPSASLPEQQPSLSHRQQPPHELQQPQQQELQQQQQQQLPQSLSSSPRPAFSLLLEPRSLLLFEGKMYTDYLHGIQAVTCDTLDHTVLNSPQAGSSSLPAALAPRDGTRYSFTFRVVNKVLKTKIKL
eukprot:gnl/Hemi2/18841_TR6243_c0_g1_i1.p1 gnl/Hemi2/18841_TR6243_c0_g1~~gnl/Hemi2/18841_TR6243_c0_g1_i1.p1  ORF type:complete len:178 (+),score=55.88 gnl/Hemi2/18841_TR6243_c0_g1_i1:1-534(+)